MNIASFSFLELVLQLRQHCPDFQRRVGGAAEFAVNTATDAQFKVPYCFCLPLAQHAGEVNQSAGTQDRHEIVAVILCIDNEEQGELAQGRASVRRVDAVAVLQKAVEMAIYTWKPESFFLMNPPQFMQRVPMGMTNTRLWFQLEFQFDFQVHCSYFAGQEIGDWSETDPPVISADKIRTIATKYDTTTDEIRSLDDSFFAAPYAEQGTDAGDGARLAFANAGMVTGVAAGEDTIESNNDHIPAKPFVHSGAQVVLIDGGGI